MRGLGSFERSRRQSKLGIQLGLCLPLTLGCGPDVGSSSSTATDPSESAATMASGFTATSGLPTISTTGDPTSNGDPTGADATGTTGPTTPPGLDCARPPPQVEPPVPEGCEHVWLEDANGDAIVGAPSGLVACPSPDGTNVYRTAAVACPELIGNECLCDADCPSGMACLCANSAIPATFTGFPASNRCMPSDCASADDCGGFMCRIENGMCLGMWMPVAVRCTSASDDCVHDSDCPRGGYCAYDSLNELFTCAPGGICE